MMTTIPRDRYTLLMVLLVPSLLISAWGVTAWDGHRLHTQQCALAMEWLQESEDASYRFENARTFAFTESWINTIEALNSPASAGQMRWGILQSARYRLTYTPDALTDQPTVLNPPDGLYARDINEGRDALVEHCPDTASLVPQAFPMVFTDGDNS